MKKAYESQPKWEGGVKSWVCMQLGLKNCFLFFYKNATCFCHSLWQGDFSRDHEQMVNRLKIPQVCPHCYLRSTEVPSRGGVRGDSM